jgi:hypothetical protein
MTHELVIRNMTRPEVDELVAWTAREGWNPGLHDAELFLATDPDAFIAADRAGAMIGGGAIMQAGKLQLRGGGGPATLTYKDSGLTSRQTYTHVVTAWTDCNVNGVFDAGVDQESAVSTPASATAQSAPRGRRVMPVRHLTRWGLPPTANDTAGVPQVQR